MSDLISRINLMVNTPRQFILWVPTLIMSALIIWLSMISQPVFHTNYTSLLDTLPLPETIHRFMAGHYKLGHPFCYAILAAITAVALRGRYALVVMLSFSLGAGLEAVQYFLPTRAGSFVDLGYNLVGVIAGTAIIWGVKSLQSKAASRRDAETAETE